MTTTPAATAGPYTVKCFGVSWCVAGPNVEGISRTTHRADAEYDAALCNAAHAYGARSRADAELVEAARKALEAVRERWTFDERQQHTHTWHDWADCKPLIDAALAKHPQP